MDSLFSVPNSLYGLNIVKRRDHTGTNRKTWFLAMWSGRGPLFWQKWTKKIDLFLSPLSRFRPKHGFIGGTRGSPSIADWSLTVSRVSHHRKKFLLAETEANLGQKWQNSATCVMWILRARALGCWCFLHFIGIKISWGSVEMSHQDLTNSCQKICWKLFPYWERKSLNSRLNTSGGEGGLEALL